MVELIALTVEGEGALEVHAERIERKLITHRLHIASRLATAMRLVEPHRSGTMAAHTKGIPVGTQSIRVGVYGLPYAKAQNRGAFIVAKGNDHRHPGQEGAKALRLGSGDFRRFTRIPATHYLEKALVAAPPIIEKTYADDFGNLERGD